MTPLEAIDDEMLNAEDRAEVAQIECGYGDDRRLKVAARAALAEADVMFNISWVMEFKERP